VTLLANLETDVAAAVGPDDEPTHGKHLGGMITSPTHFAFAPLTGPNHDISVRYRGPNLLITQAADQKETTESLGQGAAFEGRSRVGRVSLHRGEPRQIIAIPPRNSLRFLGIERKKPRRLASAEQAGLLQRRWHARCIPESPDL